MGKRLLQTRHSHGAAILVAAAIILCGTTAAQRTEDTRTLVVVGAAVVQGSNIAAAREAAIANGLMQAVSLATVEIASPEVFAEHFKKLSERLLDRPDEYIQDFKVLSEATFAKNHRVIVQATVAGTKIRETLAGAGLLLEKAAAGAARVALTVEGTGSLGNFVKFRKSIGGLAGIEGIQVQEMRPNETTLMVGYKGSAQDLAAALMLQPYDSFTVTIVETGDNSLRVALVAR
ncbi:MAG: hypothetical protein HY895_13705 [Deltaproteobacteria bacterium]|nr:hypothetical protein [Deltaproteobacteria bacterium]